MSRPLFFADCKAPKGSLQLFATGKKRPITACQWRVAIDLKTPIDSVGLNGCSQDNGHLSSPECTATHPLPLEGAINDN